jgi:hypothetical protein
MRAAFYLKIDVKIQGKFFNINVIVIGFYADVDALVNDHFMLLPPLDVSERNVFCKFGFILKSMSSVKEKERQAINAVKKLRRSRLSGGNFL